jgi:glycerol-3-phosphate acyltransferase PlsY
MIILSVVAFAIGYALGSIPFAYLVTRFFGLGDIRSVGSGNVGTTNVLRTGNKLAAGLTLLGDVGKGILAVLVAREFGDWPAMAAALGAFAGHIFPVWLNFKGGKGVATYLGILAALNLPVALMTAATWIVTALVARISSLAALVAAALSPLYMLVLGPAAYALGAAILAVLIFMTHRENISRLRAGTEPRIGARKDKPQPSHD